MARYMYIYDLRANSVAVMAKNDLARLCSSLKSGQLSCHSVCVLVQERLCSTLKSGHLPCHSVCDHSGTIAEYPQIRTASLSFSVCVLSGTVPSDRDIFPVIQCVFIQKPLFSTFKSGQLHCHSVRVFIQEPFWSTLKSGQLRCHSVCIHSGAIV